MASPRRSAGGREEERSAFGATPEQPSGGAAPVLHVLLLEDSADDADLILRELRQGGYEAVARRVAGHGEMLEALHDGPWQIVLLDYSLEGGRTALEALASLAEFDVDLPAILISGEIGDEELADALRAGARDFVNKSNLTRLAPAIARELGQVEARRRQRKGEEALKQSEQRLRLALGAGGMGTWEWDLASGRLYWSEKLESMFGLEPGAFGGTYADFIGLVHPDDRDLVGASVEQALERDSPAVVYRAVWPDGTVHWHERKSQRVLTADGRCERMAGVTFDVTEREEAAQALRESEERFRLIAEHARDLIALLDVEGRYRYLSPSCESILGYPAGALLGTAASELVHPDDWPPGWRWGAGMLREMRWRRADGSWLWVEGLSYEITGRVELHFAVIVRDISERKHAEVEREEAAQALRESEERFRLIAEHARDLIALLDVEGRYRYLSPSCESILGYSAGALLGTVASELVHPDDWPPGWRWGAGMLREMRWRRADGSWLWVEGLSYEITGRVELHFAVIVRDISERKHAEVERELLEGELRQAHKMEAVGQLAGGIAHDFNNLLAVISGYTQILLRRPEHESAGRKEIGEIGKAAERASHLSRQLLAYSRKQVLELRPLDLNDVVAKSQTMLERVIGDDIEVSSTLAAELGSISADAGQIEQIIVNLVVNARDAMPEGGRLLLETGNVTFADVSTDRPLDMSPGDYVVLAVTDTGLGMDAATVGRIFEPFYTTKERDAGTGLGLATVYGIVTQSGGQIEVESEPGLGSTFRVYFPRVAEEAEALVPEPPDERPLTGSETVLLVEDEEALRELGKTMLETYDYTVLLAADGAAALELAQNYPDPIQLLITDIQMPRMGGIELAKRLSALRPGLKVLYTSGYNDSGSSLQRLAGAKYLRKPYAMEELAGTLRDLLDPVAETS